MHFKNIYHNSCLRSAFSGVCTVKCRHPQRLGCRLQRRAGEEIETFLKREIAKPIIRWQDIPKPGYEILPNKYFCRDQPPLPTKELPEEFWWLEKKAEKMLEGLGK